MITVHSFGLALELSPAAMTRVSKRDLLGIYSRKVADEE